MPEKVTPGFVCRTPTLDDAPAMLALIQSAFDVWPRVPIDCAPIEHLRWKMQNHPRSMDAHVLVESDDPSRTLVGVTVRLLSEVNVAGQTLVSKMGTDNAVPAEWRRQGIAWAWDAYSDSDLAGRVWDLALSFRPDHPASRHKSEVRGRAFVANPIRLLHRAFTLREFLGVHGRSGGPVHTLAAVGRAAAAQLRPTRALDPDSTGVRVRAVSRFDDRADALAVAAAAQFDFSYGRSSARLNWRHADPRGGPATILLAERDEELLGYAVVRPGTHVAHLADLLVHPDRIEVAHPLVAAAVGAARSSGCAGIDAWLPLRHPYGRALSDHGLLDSGRDMGFYFYPAKVPANLRAIFEDPRALLHVTSADVDWV